MRHMTLLALTLTVSVAAQLPPDVQADRYMLQAEKAIESQDFDAAQEALDKIAELHTTHGLELPGPFYFRLAQAAGNTGSFQAAIDAIHRYFAVTGRTGDHYRDALALLARIEQRQAMDHCADQVWDVSCWKELTDPENCAVWEGRHAPFRLAAWSGACVFGKAHGKGSLTWKVADDETVSGNGQFDDGKKQGSWFERRPNGNTETGPYVDGVRNGRWTLTTADGTENDGRVEQGRYVNGKKEGTWALSWPSGQTLRNTYAEGVRSGPSVRRFRDGTRIEGQFLNWRKEGIWKTIQTDGSVSLTETYAKGMLHGPSRKHVLSFGQMGSRLIPCYSEGRYVEGKKEGRWTECEYETDSALTGDYADGLRQGRWKGTPPPSTEVDIFTGEASYEGWIEGAYEKGEKSGFWTEVQEQSVDDMEGFCYRALKLPYVDGKIHGTGWLIRHNCNLLRNQV